MDHRTIAEIAGIRLFVSGDRPAGQDFRELGHVLLGIAAIDPDRVQLQHLARQVFVEAPIPRAPRRRFGSDRLGVVEIEQHRRMARNRDQHIAEPTHHMRADRLVLEPDRDRKHHWPLDRHGKVIGPELDQPLPEGRRADGGGQRALGGVVLEILAQLRLKHLREIGVGLLLFARFQELGEPGRRRRACPSRRGWAELLPQPSAGIGRDGGEFAVPGAEAEPIGRDGGRSQVEHVSHIFRVRGDRSSHAPITQCLLIMDNA